MIPAKFPNEVDVCEPADSTWFWWWAPVLRPLPVLVLAFVHHLAVAGHPFELGGVAKALGVDPALVVGSMLTLQQHRLMGFEVRDVIVFSPIPRPSMHALSKMRKDDE